MGEVRRRSGGDIYRREVGWKEGGERVHGLNEKRRESGWCERNGGKGGRGKFVRRKTRLSGGIGKVEVAAVVVK